MRKDLFYLIYVIATTEESPQFCRGPHGEQEKIVAEGEREEVTREEVVATSRRRGRWWRRSRSWTLYDPRGCEGREYLCRLIK